ncbi:non-ribosomal peptide synthetase [Tahibacter aquaticus]|nr:non-ribosomal peptide synthetase [Tahibacter aquaticus]
MTRLYPATPMQAGLLFESLLGVSSYLIQTYPVLRGELDAGAFRRAWEQVVERHDIFRTAFVGEGEGLHQLVSAQATLPWHEEDWSGLAADEQERRFDAYRAQDKATAFDFARPPLMRVALFHLGARRYQLLWTMHHILLDGWCIPLVYRDVMQLLQAQLQGRSASLPAAPPFEAHIAWLQRQDRERAKAHWGEVLGRIDAPTPLAVDRLPAGGESGYREQFLELSQAQTEALQAAAQAQRMTVNTLVQWAWAYLLHRYSGEAEVVFGATIAGRPAEVPGIEDMVGLFINTIPVRVAFAPEQGIAAALATLQQGFQRSSDYGYLSLPEIQRQSRVRAGTPLFDSLLAFANYPLDAMTDAAAAPAASRLEIERAGHDDQTNFKLSLNANLDRILRARLAYRAEDFAQDTIERLLGHLGRILDQLPAAIAAGDGIASLLGEDEIRQLRAWGEPLREAAPDVCVHELFEAQAARTPHAVAAVFGEQQLSYGQLNAQANQVAHYLLQQGVQSDTLVGLCVERSPDMLVGMLGILKAGAAYLPLDPDYPQERIAFMLQDSAVEHVLTQNAILEALPLLGEKTVLPLDPPLRELFLAAQPEHNPGRRELGLTPRHLAYAIYTSGSTGQPKGALIEHRNVVRLVHAANYVQLSPGAVMAQASNSAFDAATFEIWGALANGMSLFHIGKETLLDPLRLARALQDGRVDTLFITTAVFNQMSIVDASGFARLQHLLFGGEGVDMEAVNRVLAAGKPRHLLHVYGPTENTTFSSFFEIVEKRADTYPIGKPIAGTTQYVLDAQRRLVPCGVTGELYLGGDGVGRGYLGQPELSNERFVADPFGSAPDARLYRSGDLVRWLPEGEVQFVGRVDDQIKIRGFRIELGEIESQLRGHEAVQETVVVARQDGGTTRLVAYVVCVPQAEERSEVLLAKDWRAYLKQRLPDYMLPAAFVVLDSLPLNSNGKVDKRRLPAPDYQAQQLYVAPQSEIEQKLADIWCQLLRIDQVGVHDNFFEMGGDSILLIQVVSRANQAGIGITTKHLFEAQTIAEVAKLASSEGAIVAPQQEICGALPLLPIHHLFLGGDACDRHHFNQSVLLQTPADFDAAALRAMVAAIYRRHDALRLRFVQEQGQWQASHAPLDAALLADSCVVETLPADPAGQRAFLSLRCNHWQAGFDLAQGPLLRAVYFAPAEAGDSGRLLLTVHHIVVDGVSWRVLLADLEQAYEQHRNGQAVVLRAKTSSFQQWGSALLDYAHSATLQQEKAYWLAQSGAQVAPLPVDREIEGQGAIATSRAVVVSLDADETRALLQQCPRAYRTQVNELLLAGVYLGMREWTGADGLRLRLEGHGRETLFDQLDITQTVGWFTSVYPLTLRSAGSDVGEVIKAVKEQYRAVPHHGIGYGVLRYLANDAELGAMAAAVDESGLEFNYLGQFDQVINADTRFQAAAEGSGAQASSRRQRSARLALSGKVFGGQMQFALSYSNSQYDESTMRRLAQLLQDGMRRVIAHCQQPGVGAYTPSDFPLARVGQPQLDAWQLRYPSLARLYPATPMQAGLLFESLLDRSAYVVQTFPILRGALDVAAFRSAWQQAVDRHDVFRTAFVEGEELHQLVLAQASLPWHEEDWSGLPAQEQQHRFEVYRAQDKQAGFDFARPPMIRLALFRLGNDRYQLLWTLHHVLLDGWCVPLVYRDVMRLYQAQLEGRAADLPPPPPYEQHIAWLQRQDGDAARSHWRNLLAQIDAPTPLVVDRLPGDGDSGRRDESVELTPEQTQALQATAQAQHTTVNTLVQWAWAYLLHRYSGESDVVFGATISGRPAAVPGIEEMIGLFINAIPVKVSFGTQRSVAASIAALHQDFQRSNDFAYLSLPEIQRQSRVRAGTPLFDSLMEFGNYPLDAMADVAATPAASELQLERRGHDEASNYKLGLNVSFGRTLKVKIGYRAEQFAQATLQRLLRHLARVLAQLPAAVAGTGTIGSVLDEAELAQLHDWGSGPQLALPVLCAHQLFEAQVRRDGQATAVVCGEQRLSYAELNAQANRVARYLLDQGVRPDSLVGLCVERSPDMLVGLLGILKAGAAYLPLDPEYPEDRIAYMLQDSAVEHVLTHSAVLEALPLLGDKTVLPLDGPMRDLLLGAYADGDIDPAESAVTPAHLAYAIYTSGSTGTPKGVLLEHRGLVNLAQNQSRLHALSPRSRVLAFASLSFDAATWEWLMALSNGASLHICAQDERYSAPRLSALLLEQGITHATLPPALLAQLDASADYALQVLVVAGEACDEQLAWTWAQRCRVCNAYGPTETTVCATQSDVLPGQRISLGRALANFDVQVLDAQLQPQPAGLPGELCIGGAGLARGYLNQPQLTAERFVAHPQRPGERLYRSGDLVRWLPDGELQFLGRVDSQVKIRGFRVELGEIEARLAACDGVRQAVVVAREDVAGSKRLVAYLVVAAQRDTLPNEVLLAKQWAQQLRQQLPDYMVPAAFVIVEQIPLTGNGKVDQRRLPAPDYQGQQDYVAPQSATETTLLAAWSDLLKLDSLGVTHDFFDLGGDSILIMRMSMEIKAAFAVELPVREIFERPTIRSLAARIDELVLQQSLKTSISFDVDAAESNNQELIEL